MSIKVDQKTLPHGPNTVSLKQFKNPTNKVKNANVSLKSIKQSSSTIHNQTKPPIKKTFPNNGSIPTKVMSRTVNTSIESNQSTAVYSKNKKSQMILNQMLTSPTSTNQNNSKTISNNRTASETFDYKMCGASSCQTAGIGKRSLSNSNL